MVELKEFGQRHNLLSGSYHKLSHQNHIQLPNGFEIALFGPLHTAILGKRDVVVTLFNRRENAVFKCVPITIRMRYPQSLYSNRNPSKTILQSHVKKIPFLHKTLRFSIHLYLPQNNHTEVVTLSHFSSRAHHHPPSADSNKSSSVSVERNLLNAARVLPSSLPESQSQRNGVQPI